MALRFRREALGSCATVAKSASDAFAGLSGLAPGKAAFGDVPGSQAMATAVSDLLRMSGTAAEILGSRLSAVDRTLDAVEQTVNRS
ncbi:hypothetical protein [Nonomuraea aurantiaca]|uniref:hypothetical protein n=1 Tax=Nonomuraea aurantiaca TaxID=2878562 RepID=UPI001CD9CF3E|nr:hypothetical protein [Nonomuraea aurantiaca]MCA2230357.1 hypothetical protein [Nonomuraea aurantiaca]